MPYPATLPSVIDPNKSSVKIPHIEVKITVGDESIAHYGSQFIDAIKFIADAEAAVRAHSGLKEPVDITVDAIQKENMRKLMEGFKK